MSENQHAPVQAESDAERDIVLSVATIGFDGAGQLLIHACNDAFLRMSGGHRDSRLAPQTFPLVFDAVFMAAAVGAAKGAAALTAFRDKLLACFASPAADWREQTVDLRVDRACWRLTLTPIRGAHAGGEPRLREILVSGFETGASAALLPAVADQPAANTSRYRALVDLAYDAIVTMNDQHNITLFNRAAENMFGYTSAEILGRPIVTLLPEKFRAKHPQKVQRFAENYQPNVRQATPPRMDDSNSVFGLHRDGAIIPVEISVSKIELNGATEFMAVVRDISDRAQLMALLKEQADTDGLTGLPNRRAFMTFLAKALAVPGPLSVFILDIDNFKVINDRYGHDAGDDVLRALAHAGTQMSDAPCMFARWGGEEFVAAFPGADIDRAGVIAERLRQRYERQQLNHHWREAAIPFTVSIGVVARDAAASNVDVLMKRADLALYRAKASGRNRVERG